MIAAAIHCNAANYLRVNQIGYLVDDVKVAVIMMEHGDALNPAKRNVVVR